MPPSDVKIGLVASEPRIVSWTDQAVVKANVLGIARADIEDAVMTRHRERSRNTGAADWLVVSGRIVIAYNHPAGDELTALVVTVWRQS
jgi:hypothetical protein